MKYLIRTLIVIIAIPICLVLLVAFMCALIIDVALIPIFFIIKGDFIWGNISDKIARFTGETIPEYLQTLHERDLI